MTCADQDAGERGERAREREVGGRGVGGGGGGGGGEGGGGEAEAGQMERPAPMKMQGVLGSAGSLKAVRRSIPLLVPDPFNGSVRHSNGCVRHTVAFCGHQNVCEENLTLFE